GAGVVVAAPDWANAAVTGSSKLLQTKVRARERVKEVVMKSITSGNIGATSGCLHRGQCGLLGSHSIETPAGPAILRRSGRPCSSWQVASRLVHQLITRHVLA